MSIAGKTTRTSALAEDRITVFVGVSGSGESPIVFDTVAVEAQRQLIQNQLSRAADGGSVASYPGARARNPGVGFPIRSV